MKNSPNINRLLEIFWLIVAVLTALMSVYTLITTGIKSAYMFMIMCALSLLLYLTRRGLRRKNSADMP
jgi:Flp pilus assembly protein TadB